MIAADTSSLSAFFLEGEKGRDVERLPAAFAAGELVVPAVVLTEILSDPEAGKSIDAHIPNLLTLEVHDGYWARAGHTRRLLKTRNYKARVADALIAQACIDNDVALITRDIDFRHFAKHCGLKLA
jgi:predicted nucleic acid-binding protein